MEAIALKNGIRCVNTLTGFKWISEKIGDYEDVATTALRENEGIAWDYDNTDFYTRAEILQRYSKFTVFAAEESFGYLPLDTVRDKDGNAAALACRRTACSPRAYEVIAVGIPRIFIYKVRLF